MPIGSDGEGKNYRYFGFPALWIASSSFGMLRNLILDWSGTLAASIAMLTGFDSGEKRSRANAEVIVRDLGELQKLLEIALHLATARG